MVQYNHRLHFAIKVLLPRIVVNMGPLMVGLQILSTLGDTQSYCETFAKSFASARSGDVDQWHALDRNALSDGLAQKPRRLSRLPCHWPVSCCREQGPAACWWTCGRRPSAFMQTPEQVMSQQNRVACVPDHQAGRRFIGEPPIESEATLPEEGHGILGRQPED
jgi:hypothetical protein